MPEHTQSPEASYLTEVWQQLVREYPDRWVAVSGYKVVDSDEDPVRLTGRVRSNALFAFIPTEPLA